MIYLDTHVVAWLFAGKIGILPQNVRDEIARKELVISPMVILELQDLFEIGRVAEKVSVVVHDLAERIDLHVCTLAFGKVMEHAVQHSWTRDPFDRIIVAQASVRSNRPVTKDEQILKNYIHAFWRKP